MSARCRKFVSCTDKTTQDVKVIDYGADDIKPRAVEVLEGTSRHLAVLWFLSTIEPGDVYAVTEGDDYDNDVTFVYYRSK
jgi:hypothetical protein